MGSTIPQHDNYSVITYIEPLERNKRVLGFNVLSDENVRETLLKSIKTNDITVTPVIELVQNKKSRPGIIFYQTIYEHDHLINGEIDIHKRHPLGFLASCFYLEDIIHAALANLDQSRVTLELYDLSSHNKPELLYSNKIEPNSFLNSNQQELLSFQKVLHIADRQWKVQFSTLPNYNQKSWSSWFILTGSLIFTAMFSGFLLALSGRNAFIKKAVEEKTKDLGQINYLLTRTNAALATTNQKLQDSEFQFKKLVQTQAAIVWRFDIQKDCFTFVSDGAESLLGYASDDW